MAALADEVAMCVEEPGTSNQRREVNRNRAAARSHDRVRARPILPGVRYKVTRRCLGRQFLLVPDSPDVRNIIGYCLGVALERYSIDLHAACVLSNHMHLDVTDRLGVLPEFKCLFNSLVARVLNHHRGRFDALWSPERGCDVQMLTDSDLVEGIAYTLTNPVDAGLVKWSHRWPGLTTANLAFGESMSFRRPNGFFDDEHTDLPKRIEVTIVRPTLEKMSPAEFDKQVADSRRTRELRKHAEMRDKRRRFMGEHRVARQRWSQRPPSAEPRFAAAPRVSSRSRWARIVQLRRNANWDEAYADARKKRLRGEDPVFPAGTYALRRRAGVRVASPP